MKYKILAALLAAITATTLCGCGESEKQDETTTVQASTQATTQAKTTAATTKAAPNTEAEASNVTQAEAETDAQAQPQEETAAETEAQSSQSAMTREEIISEVLSNTGAGEHAEYDIDKDGNVYVNNQKLEEPYIAEKSYGLFNDQYGNYVVQYCINLCDYEINKIFVDNFLYDILKFSTQKYSSNIIEKCMDCCDENTKELIAQKNVGIANNFIVQNVLLISIKQNVIFVIKIFISGKMA